ncbi:MAG: hydroxymethylglutaryl-CoA reductase [Blastococcus sp.]
MTEGTRTPVPRDPVTDHTHEMAAKRRAFVAERTGEELEHVGRYSVDPALLSGNVENFAGVAQVPIGIAGPLLIHGEHAEGEFYVPLATTEGTLVASYNRGMRLLTECGGVRATVIEAYMQRSPVFLFDDAVAARDFGAWVDAHLEDVRMAAESTTRTGRLAYIGQYQVGPLRYLRLNFTTGDAAGQNMCGKAALAACAWIQEHHAAHPRFLLSGNIDTDKKHSRMNMLHTRGRRVVAEAVVRRNVLQRLMRVDTTDLNRMRTVSATGTFLAGAANNGAHAANGLAAMFIACGQDAANVAESHAGIVYTRLLDDGDYYWSITLPALIVGTVGGGTGLPTQHECLAMLGCAGPGKVNKLAEIVAAVVLAGETSLASAVIAGEWVSSHEAMGRNRPG